MTLPKLSQPIATIEIPSTKKNHKFRPYLVKEEKILLMAKTSSVPSDWMQAIKQTVNNCCVDKGFDVNKLTLFDLEYVFLKLRAISVNNVIDGAYKDEQDNKSYPFQINLDTVHVKWPDGKVNNKISIGKNIVLEMHYPESELYDDKDFLENKDDALYGLIIKCLDKVYEGEKMHDLKTSSRQEIDEFLDGLPVSAFNSIKDFLLNVPSIECNFNYTRDNGETKEVSLKSLQDFFTLL